jgi:hypothetical protein
MSTASFSEETSKAIMDLLVLNSAKLTCLREEIALITAISLRKSPKEIEDIGVQRLVHHYQRLKEQVWEHYGEMDLNNLLNTPPFDSETS